MTRDEYERRKERLKEQLQAGVGLLESAYQAQVRALDLVWMLQAEESAAGAPDGVPSGVPEPQPAAARRRGAAEVDDDVREGFGRLPERFTRGDVCEVLRYEPDRGALYRSLQQLVAAGSVRVESPGAGQRATVYSKIGGVDSPRQG
jgi:hypothetical protein